MPSSTSAKCMGNSARVSNHQHKCSEACHESLGAFQIGGPILVNLGSVGPRKLWAD